MDPRVKPGDDGVYVGRSNETAGLQSSTPPNSQLQTFRTALLIGIIKKYREACVSTVKLTVNGKSVSASVEDRTLLVHLLRENLNLTGTHVGCDTSQCGACIVH